MRSGSEGEAHAMKQTSLLLIPNAAPFETTVVKV
jgi:hypothetical protein